MKKIIFLIALVSSLYSKNILTVSYMDMRDYLFDHYPNISTNQKNVIYDEVIRASNEFNINPVWLFAILDNESDYRSWIKHSTVYVEVHGKRVKTNAIGMGGVIYEIWEEPLKRNKIIETKSDLYDTRCNIRATAYIFSHYLTRPKLKQCRTVSESALLRYYGVKYNGKKLDKFYYKKINTFLGDVARYSIKDCCD